tara:strand:+ start:527 stop:838 length:312 start_codon:yes stop_codon:yes gene_type:complete
MLNEIKFMLNNNMNIIISVLVLVVCAFFAGRKTIDTSRATLCKNDIIALNQCLDDQSKNQKYYLDEVTRIKSKYEIDNQIDICKNEIQAAIENYKQLNQLFCE